MFDMSWGEMLIIGGVALVAIGPKDLPKALRTFGQVVGKARRMAGQFQAQFNEAIREADLEELRKDISDINDAVAPFKSQFDPIKNANEQLQKALGSAEAFGLSDPTLTSGIPDQSQPNAIGSGALPQAVKAKRAKTSKSSEPGLLGAESDKKQKAPAKQKVAPARRKSAVSKAEQGTPVKTKTVANDSAPVKNTSRAASTTSKSGKKA